MPKEVLFILNKLNEVGFEAYIVGGCVRDKLLGLIPHDYDITTSAEPQEIKRVFKDFKTILIGEEFGTIGILIDETLYEVTTFRIDGKYKNFRKPENVIFSKNLVEDLKRRDFTINAMAMDSKGELYDPFGGKNDLEDKVLRAVGRPNERLKEDAIRILRAIRFAGRLNLYIDDELFDAISFERKLLKKISPERIFDEFSKMITSDRPSYYLLLMEETGVLDVIFPELKRTVGFSQFSPYHDKTLFDHLICVMDEVKPDLALRLAALFHDISKVDTLSIGEDGRGHFYGHEILGADLVSEILKRLRVSNKIIDKVKILILDHMKVHSEMTDKALRRQIKRVGRENVLDLYDLLIADCKCTRIDRDASFIINRKNRVKELLDEKEMKTEKFLEIDGNDIKALGFNEGKIIGKILKDLENLVLDDPEKNKKDYLLEYINKNYR
ncbi:CCA tRNA nucleotidyltransferase [Peptoniphilus gorbachii]|uniref:tRNA nucleotidyltransferase (CCA-adding enzyme) n=1 Tax=Peptoniphilus gorbachii TaxID=411567 RepID=A0ABS2MKW5_9FIRM|nr:HD domain-containing protein [Peptoniphilus gorbachii]MBM7550662.1 tRNA nucleotidyltransferase (CCA-adding enzyme) [Peptoniphilus gorbachii]